MTHSTKRIVVDMVAFRRDVEAGTTVLVLAEKYGIAKSTVWRLKAQISGKLARREQPPEFDEGDAPEAFDVTVTVDTDKLDYHLAAATDAEIRDAVMNLNPQSKADLFTSLLQGRLNQQPADPPAEPGEEHAQQA